MVLRSGLKWRKVGDMDEVFLSGTFEHSLDAKGRVTLPARYREHFRGGVVLVRLPDEEPCISVYHPAAWAKLDTKYIEPLDVFANRADAWRMRDIYSNQDRIEPDGQGRVLLSTKHINEAGLAGKVTIIGVRDHLEIWDPETYARRRQEMGGPDDA
jgi:MraZ protein